MTTSPEDPADLELPPEVMRTMGRDVLERVVAHLASLSDQPARGDTRAEDLCRALREPPPEQGAAFEPMLDSLFRDWIPRSFNSAGPGYLAYIPGGGLFTAALADLIADATNRYTGVWRAAPALVQLEANVLDWFREWMGFPPGTRGLLTTGGSMSIFNAVLCARERLLGPEIRAGRFTCSPRPMPRSSNRPGWRGSCPIASGRFRPTISSGCVPTPWSHRSARTAARGCGRSWSSRRPARPTPGPWIHWRRSPRCAPAKGCGITFTGLTATFFHLVEELRPLLAGLPRADSLTLDPHKGLFLPYGTGALLVRDGSALRAVHGMQAGYLPPAADEEFYDPAQHGPDLSRGFPGLRVWLTIKTLGVARLRAAIAEKRALAVAAAERLVRQPGISLVAPPQLSLLAFQLQPVGASAAMRDEATRRLLERVNARGQVMLTGCTVDGRFLAGSVS